MKKTNILIAVLVIIGTVPMAKAGTPLVDFDGKFAGGISYPENLRAVAFLDNSAAIPVPEVTEPVPQRDGVISLDYSILNTIKYCDKNRIKDPISSNLKKLLVYGTQEEKKEFLRSPEYTFPTRFVSFGEVLISFNGNKDAENECHKVNCRIERVCGFIETCKNVVDVACAATEAAALSSVPAAAWALSAAYAAGGVFCVKYSEKKCETINDCKDVEKCDIVCHTDGNPCYTTPGGAVQCQ